MNLQHLDRFMAIVRHGSLSRAARALNITEPALSKSLRKLEEELQVRLLDRGPRGMTPTLFGEALIARGRLILGEVETTRRELEELRGVSRGMVRVGSRPSFGSTLLPRAIARLQEKRPGVKAIVREGFTPNLVAEVIQGSLDFVVISEARDLDSSLQQETLYESPVGVLARAGHPLAGNRPVVKADLAGASWVMPLKTDPVRQRLEMMLEDDGLTGIDVVAESNSTAFVMSYVRESDAIGFFPRAMVEYHGGDGGLCFLNLPSLSWQRQFSIVRRHGTSLSPAAQLLIREMKGLARPPLRKAG